MMKARSILNIIAKSKSPHFAIFKQAYVYGIIKASVSSYMRNELGLMHNQELPAFECYMHIAHNTVKITCTSSIAHVKTFFALHSESLHEFLGEDLKKEKIISRPEQVMVECV